MRVGKWPGSSWLQRPQGRPGGAEPLWELGVPYCSLGALVASCPTPLLVPERLFLLHLGPSCPSPPPQRVTVVTWASRWGTSVGQAWDSLAACSSALWRWALGRQGVPRGREPVISAPAGTVPHRCRPGCVPCLPGGLDRTSWSKAQVAPRIFRSTHSRGQVCV